jgi:hypothetical protein
MKNKRFNRNSFKFKRATSFQLCKILLLILVCFTTNSFAQKTYNKEFYNNGQLKVEGWILDNEKTDYWKFYYRNGKTEKEGTFKNNVAVKYWYFYTKNGIIEKEGHFKKGEKSNWWLFYDKDGNVNHKCQLKNNQKNGYCLIYSKKKIVKASKFKEGKKIKEWTDFSSFRRENSLNDLR